MATTTATTTVDLHGANHMLALEPRFMYDAAAPATADAVEEATDPEAEVSDPEDASSQEDDGDSSLADAAIAFVDGALDDAEVLVAALEKELGEENVVQFDEFEDIADALETQSQLDAIHLYSHGESGEVTLGDIRLNADNLEDYSEELGLWGSALTETGDILFYGCDIAEGEAGEEFIRAIATATDADVAASTDDTGAEELGGDWELEYTHGEVETAAIAVESYDAGLLDTVTVADAGTAGSSATAETSGAEIGGAAVSIAVDATVDVGGYYDNGSITFQITNATENDQLALPDAVATASTDSGVLSVVGTDVYLGDGSTATKIGTIDDTLDGVAGGTAYDSVAGTVTLQINFEAPTAGTEELLTNSSGTNGGFEDGDTSGWTIFEGGIFAGNVGVYPNATMYGSTTTLYDLNGQSVDYAFVDDAIGVAGVSGEGTGTVALDGSASALTTASITVDTTTASEGSSSLKLNSIGAVTATSVAQVDGNYSIHGPYVRSDTFTVNAGDEIAVDWKAEYTQDAYEIFAFLVGPGGNGTFGDDDDNRIMLFSQRGDVQDWTTFTTAVPIDGDFQFEFVAGSYDEDGLGGLGATLYLDNVRTITGAQYNIDEAEIDAIGAALTYQNVFSGTYDGTGYSTDNRDLTTTLTPQTGSSVSDNSIIFINEPPDGADDVVTIQANTSYTITYDDFGFSDVDNHDSLAVTITTLPDQGTLSLYDSATDTTTDVTANDRILVSDFDDGDQLIFTPDVDTEGTPYTSFTFQVEDNGGGNTNLDLAPNTITINVSVAPEPVEEEEEIPLDDPAQQADPTPLEDAGTDMILDVGEAVPETTTIEVATGIVSEFSFDEVADYDVGDVGGTESDDLVFDRYVGGSEGGNRTYQLVFPDTLSFDPSADTAVASSNEGLLPMESIQFMAGSDFQSPTLKFASLDPDASGEAEVTVEGVDENGVRTQHTFKVTVENGEVKNVEYLGASEAEEGELESEGGIPLEGGLSPEEAQGGATPPEGPPGEDASGEGGAPSEGAPPPGEGDATLPEGVLPEEGAMLLPIDGIPLSVFGFSVGGGLPADGLVGHSLTSQLQQATQGAFAARQASLLGVLYGVAGGA